ncbi:MAG: alpha/beta hydrolase-fold protein [Pseudonocardiales bacterium]
MSLLGTPFITLLIGLTLGLVVVTVALWQRLSQRTLPRVTGRALLVVACQAMAVVTVAALINQSFVFFSTWSELIGSTGPNSARVQALDPGGRVGGFVVGNVSNAVARKQGQLIFRWIGGQRTHLGTRAYVYLPPQYFSPAYRHQRFPVAVWLTGYPGSPGEIVRYLGLIQSMNKGVTGGLTRPMVLVMLHPTLVPPRDTECANVAHGPQVETYLSSDLPTVIRSSYRVTRDRNGWAIAGLSTGGFCAVKAAMHHPEVFYAAVGMSGYYHALLDGTTGALYGGSQRLRNDNSPEWLLQHRPAPALSVLITYSRDESTIAVDNQGFLALVRPPMIAYRLVLPTGGHNFGVFASEMPAVVNWLGARLTPASDTPVQALPSHPHSSRASGQS